MIWLLIAVLPYSLFFLVLWIILQQEKVNASSLINHNTGQKLLTVVIPIKNEAANIQNLLNDLAEQSLDPGYFEVIMVDDGSTDSTYDRLRSCNRLHNLKIIEAGGAGKKKALVLGIRNATGEYIVTTDGDCRVKQDWLQAIYNFVTKYNADMFIGAVDIIDAGGFMNRFIQLEFLGLQAVTEVFARHGKPVMCNGANLCFRNPGHERYADMVKEYVNSGDDIFLMESYRKQGKIITWIDSPSSLVETHAPGSIIQFLKERIRWTSKSPYYSLSSLIALASLVFLTNLYIISILVTAIFFPVLWITVLALYLMKSIPDFLLLVSMARKRGKVRLLNIFLPVQLLYPFYVVITGMAGLLTGLFFSRKGK